MVNLKCIGLMSGTSMDGIDAALIKTDGQTSLKQLYTHSLKDDPIFQILLKSAEYVVKKCDGDLKLAIKRYKKLAEEYLATISQDIKPLVNYLYNGEDGPLSLQAIIDNSTILHAKVVMNLLNKAKMKSEEIDLVGFIEVGNGQLLANKVGITVIDDFRTNDVKNGRQGTPLAPVYHQALAIRDKNYPIVVLNCGGISNITLINGKDGNNLIGFDTGPGNALIDRYIRIHKLESMDKDDKYGLKGEVNEKVMKLLFEKAVIKDGVNYFNIVPPKSLDSGDFNDIPELDQLRFEDACATLEAFTAFTIVDSLKFIKTDIPKKWVLAGGGWNNPVITCKLKEYLKDKIKYVEVVTSNQIGWDSKYMEYGSRNICLPCSS